MLRRSAEGAGDVSGTPPPAGIFATPGFPRVLELGPRTRNREGWKPGPGQGGAESHSAHDGAGAGGWIGRVRGSAGQVPDHPFQS